MLWGASAAEARDLLSGEYKPSERVSSGRFGGKRKSPSTIYRLYKAAENYDTIHPVYSYEKILPDTPILGIGSDCGGKGVVGVSYAEDESRCSFFSKKWQRYIV